MSNYLQNECNLVPVALAMKIILHWSWNFANLIIVINYGSSYRWRCFWKNLVKKTNPAQQGLMVHHSVAYLNIMYATEAIYCFFPDLKRTTHKFLVLGGEKCPISKEWGGNDKKLSWCCYELKPSLSNDTIHDQQGGAILFPQFLWSSHCIEYASVYILVHSRLLPVQNLMCLIAVKFCSTPDWRTWKP